jgi:hypothetical protein
MGPGQFAAGAEIRNPSMLPGFRFLFAAILLSASILVFGLGAAALLRATHEQYVSNPSWRNGPQEKVFAQAADPAQPVLAALRAEPEPAEPTPSLRDQVPTIGLPASEPEQVALTSKPTPATPSGASASSAFDMASAKFAALNDPATTAWKDPPAKAKADSGSPESKATKPRAHRVKKRRRIVRRPPPPVQQLDPFGQPQPALAATTARARQ